MHGLAEGVAAFGEREQLLRQIAGSLCSQHGVLQDVPGGFGNFAFAQRQGDVAEDDGEQVIEVMGDTTGKKTEGFDRYVAVQGQVAQRIKGARSSVGRCEQAPLEQARL